ncbi:FHA domain-containing protein [Actinocrinis puniceicyclus]|uniref:FHA domain-containing protein n=1 Tax=Actinocrinis puniceicyclus TaxID=977794 RepID=A0A8J8BDN4_9ACTN|nr:FHA domain-containing protein [Actinocrinis puniceicyclus]MBS2964660.1 FHA domain-containing protein [Actinocrinis puniceicyclus]
MARCPSGHESQTTDYCDTCGAVMGGAPVTAVAPLEGTALLSGGGAPGEGAGEASCPQCGAERGGRFCEECGYDYEMAQLLPPEPVAQPSQTPQSQTPQSSGPVAAPQSVAEPQSTPPAAAPVQQAGHEGAVGRAPTGVVVTADRDYYTAQVERGDIVEDEFPFPKYPVERRFALDGQVLRIGRASTGRGIAVEIDLTGPPLDPAVSHLHAQLLRGPDGGWRVVDLGSANGTRLNGAEQRLPVETEVPVNAGDRIHVGVWTTLTLEEF